MLRLVAAVGLSTALLAACGGAGDGERSAAAILQQTFRDNEAAVRDGYLSLSVRLDPAGPQAGPAPITITLLGPFEEPRPGEPERFSVELAAMSAKATAAADVLSTRTRVLVTLGGRTYDAGSRAAANDGGGLPVTHFDPLRWIEDARTRPRERAAGAETIRVAGAVDVERLLGDLDGLLPAADTARPRAIRLTPQLRRRMAAAARSSSIDIWTGASDRLLRQIAVRVAFSLDDEDHVAPLVGRDGATINVHVRLDDVNERSAPASTFAAPRGTRVRPLAAGPGGESRGLLECVAIAGGGSSELARCLSQRAR